MVIRRSKKKKTTVLEKSRKNVGQKSGEEFQEVKHRKEDQNNFELNQTQKISSKIILVGNGTSNLNFQNGRLIDKFETVLRFNSFKIKGYEKYVGGKTDIWFTANTYHMNRIEEFREVISHSWQWDSDKCKMFQRLLSKRKDCIKTVKSFVKKIPVDHASSGLVAIHMMLQRYDRVTITGFDWWNTKKHHYGDEEIRGKIHNPAREFEIIKDLSDKGKVIMLR